MDTDIYTSQDPAVLEVVPEIAWILIGVVSFISVGSFIWGCIGRRLDREDQLLFIRELRKDREVEWISVFLPALGFDRELRAEDCSVWPCFRKSAKVLPLVHKGDEKGDNLGEIGGKNSFTATPRNSDPALDSLINECHPMYTALHIRMAQLVGELQVLPASPEEIFWAASNPLSPESTSAGRGAIEAFPTGPSRLDPFATELAAYDSAISRRMERDNTLVMASQTGDKVVPMWGLARHCHLTQPVSHQPDGATLPLKAPESPDRREWESNRDSSNINLVIPPTPGSRLAELSVSSLKSANAALVKWYLRDISGALKPDSSEKGMARGMDGLSSVGASEERGDYHDEPQASETFRARFSRMKASVYRISCLRALYLHPAVSPFTLFIPHQSRPVRTLFLATVLLGPLWLAAFIYSNLWWNEITPLLPPIKSASAFLALSATTVAFSLLLQVLLYFILIDHDSFASRRYSSFTYPLLTAEYQRRELAETLLSRVDLAVIREFLGGGGKVSIDSVSLASLSDENIGLRDPISLLQVLPSSSSFPTPSLPDDFDAKSRIFPYQDNLKMCCFGWGLLFWLMLAFLALSISYPVLFACLRGIPAAHSLLLNWALSQSILLLVISPLTICAHTFLHMIVVPYYASLPTSNSGFLPTLLSPLINRARDEIVGNAPRGILTSRVSLFAVPAALCASEQVRIKEKKKGPRLCLYAPSPSIALLLTTPMCKVSAVLEAPLYRECVTGWPHTLSLARAALTRRAYCVLLLGLSADSLRRERLAIRMLGEPKAAHEVLKTLQPEDRDEVPHTDDSKASNVDPQPELLVSPETSERISTNPAVSQEVHSLRVDDVNLDTGTEAAPIARRIKREGLIIEEYSDPSSSSFKTSFYKATVPVRRARSASIEDNDVPLLTPRPQLQLDHPRGLNLSKAGRGILQGGLPNFVTGSEAKGSHEVSESKSKGFNEGVNEGATSALDESVERIELERPLSRPLPRPDRLFLPALGRMRPPTALIGGALSRAKYGSTTLTRSALASLTLAPTQDSPSVSPPDAQTNP